MLNSEAYSRKVGILVCVVTTHDAVLVTAHCWPIFEMFLFPLDIGSKLQSVMTPGGLVFEVVMCSYLFTPLERLCLVIHLNLSKECLGVCLCVCIGHIQYVCVLV